MRACNAASSTTISPSSPLSKRWVGPSDGAMLGTVSGAAERTFDGPLPVHAAVTRVGGHDPADGAVGPGRARDLRGQLLVGQLREQGEGVGPNGQPDADELVERLAGV